MSHFADHRSFYNKPIFLSPHEIRSPLLVFDDFFADYNLCELRELLSQIRDTCLVADDGPFKNAENRARLLLDLKRLEKMMEAGFVVSQKKKAKSNPLLIEFKTIIQ